MKLLKYGLRFWITLTSVMSFVGGWIMLAHAPKPTQLLQNAANPTLPTLEPLPPLSDSGSGNNDFQSQSLFSIQPRRRSIFAPIFRTGGS